jgi:hypothetical protein
MPRSACLHAGFEIRLHGPAFDNSIDRRSIYVIVVQAIPYRVDENRPVGWRDSVVATRTKAAPIPTYRLEERGFRTEPGEVHDLPLPSSGLAKRSEIFQGPLGRLGNEWRPHHPEGDHRLTGIRARTAVVN